MSQRREELHVSRLRRTPSLNNSILRNKPVAKNAPLVKVGVCAIDGVVTIAVWPDWMSVRSIRKFDAPGCYTGKLRCSPRRSINAATSTRVLGCGFRGKFNHLWLVKVV